MPMALSRVSKARSSRARADAVAEVRVAPDERALQVLRVRLDQKLVGIEAMSLGGLVRTMYSIAVEKSGTSLGQIGVPDIIGTLRHVDALDLAAALRVEQAQLDALGILGEEREVDAGAVPRGAAREAARRARRRSSATMVLGGVFMRVGDCSGRPWPRLSGLSRQPLDGRPARGMRTQSGTIPELVAQLVERLVESRTTRRAAAAARTTHRGRDEVRAYRRDVGLGETPRMACVLPSVRGASQRARSSGRSMRRARPARRWRA